MREPSLHLKEKDLARILKKVHPIKYMKWHGEINSYPTFAMKILEMAKGFNASSRSIKVTNDKIEKKVIKLRLINRGNAAFFAQILLLERRRLKHKGISLIKVGSKDWFELKEICKLATDFCNEYQLNIKKGYAEYIRLGLGKMKGFSINKFKALHSAIYNEFEAMQLIAQDKTPLKTKEIHDIYMGLIQEKTGYTQGYESYPEKYQYFVRAKQEAMKYGVGPKVYIMSQFQAFEWVSAIPDPAQLVGVKAVERLQKYAYNHSIMLGDKKNIVDFSKIKKHGKSRNHH